MAAPLLTLPTGDERNPFHGKGLAVTLALLLEPRRQWTLAELALRAQASRPMVTKVVESLRRRGYVVGDVSQGRRAGIRPTAALFAAAAAAWPRPQLWLLGGTVPDDLPTGGGYPVSAALGIPWDAPPRVYVRSRAMIPEVLARAGGALVSEAVGEWGITVVDFPLDPGPLPPLVAALELGHSNRGRQTLDSHAQAITGAFADAEPDMTTAPRPPVTIAVPATMATTVARLTEATGRDVVLVGGWGVTCRLRMARFPVRATEDVDVILRPDARPARAALHAVEAVQADDAHPCRLAGLPLTVDLLADSAGERVDDPDGLRLLVPPFAGLLVRTAEPVRLVEPDGRVEATVGLPRAGALFAAKAGNLALEVRDRPKRANDSEDALRLLDAFGSLALLGDLAAATEGECAELRRNLDVLGPGGLAGPARDTGYVFDTRHVAAAVAGLLAGLG